ncbi:hypothetical protein Tco_1334268, partial [Tanacetum coccineum]
MASPVRTDEQIVPPNRWVPIGKSNCYLSEENLNPALFLRSLKAGSYKCQLDEQWFDLTQDTLRYAHNFTQVKRNLAQPESPLHLPTEEPVLGNIKFSGKGTKREVFGMTIPNELINDVIRGADYYDAYLEKVAKHQRYLAGEEVSDPDSLTKPAKQTKLKPTKQSKPTKPKAASKKPKPAPAKPHKKKRKPVS